MERVPRPLLVHTATRGHEKFETGATIHLAFDHFESVDLALYLTSTPGHVHGRGDSGDIPLQAVGETDNRPELTVFGTFNPTA